MNRNIFHVFLSQCSNNFSTFYVYWLLVASSSCHIEATFDSNFFFLFLFFFFLSFFLLLWRFFWKSYILCFLSLSKFLWVPLKVKLLLPRKVIASQVGTGLDHIVNGNGVSQFTRQHFLFGTLLSNSLWSHDMSWLDSIHEFGQKLLSLRCNVHLLILESYSWPFQKKMRFFFFSPYMH